MRVVTIERPGMGSYAQPVEEIISALDGELESWISHGAEPGETIVLTLKEMGTREYQQLSEFEGW